MFSDKQKAGIISRLSVMMNYEEDVRAIYGKDYKNTIEMWSKPDDKYYPFKGTRELSNPFEKNRGVQANKTR